MRMPWCPVIVVCFALAACKQPPLPAPPSPSPGGWTRVSESATGAITCGELPVLVDISHATVRLAGNCGYVRVLGEHLDVYVEMAPGGTVDITGAHNDVYWTQARRGPPPTLLNRGDNNTFHEPES